MRISDWSSDVCSSDLRALRQEIRTTDLRRLLLEDVDEGAADDLALALGIVDALQLAEEELAGVAVHQRDVVVMAEQLDHLPGLVLAQQAVVDEDAGELLADRLVDQHCRHRGVAAAGAPADDPRLADLLADRLERLLAAGRPGPVAPAAADFVGDVGK